MRQQIPKLGDGLSSPGGNGYRPPSAVGGERGMTEEAIVVEGRYFVMLQVHLLSRCL